MGHSLEALEACNRSTTQRLSAYAGSLNRGLVSRAHDLVRAYARAAGQPEPPANQTIDDSFDSLDGVRRDGMADVKNALAPQFSTDDAGLLLRYGNAPVAFMGHRT